MLLDELKIYVVPYWQSTTKQYFKEESLKIHKISLKNKNETIHSWTQAALRLRSWQAGQQHSAVNPLLKNHWLCSRSCFFPALNGVWEVDAYNSLASHPNLGQVQNPFCLQNLHEFGWGFHWDRITVQLFLLSALRLSLHFHRSWSQNIPDILLPTNAFWVCLCLLVWNLTCNSLSVYKRKLTQLLLCPMYSLKAVTTLTQKVWWPAYLLILSLGFLLIVSSRIC